MMDYHQVVTSRMCLVGQQLRMQAYNMAVRIQSADWMNATPVERARMLNEAREAGGNTYVLAFNMWREHYSKCQTCKMSIQEGRNGKI